MILLRIITISVLYHSYHGQHMKTQGNFISYYYYDLHSLNGTVHFRSTLTRGTFKVDPSGLENILVQSSLSSATLST